MRTRLVLGCMILVSCAVPIFCQEGHPLTGTWTGDAGASATDRQHITIVMNWDGKAITGILNPGPNAAPLRTVTLDGSTWTVRMQIDAKDGAGKPLAIAVEGKIDNLGSAHRTIKGTWRQGAITSEFRLTRD
ncbi:MAG: hypothetical protein ABI811_04445 [Acidobacteriota bacterium]